MILNRDETVVSEVTVLTGSGGVQRPAHGVPRKGKVKRNGKNKPGVL
jgi:hypothetical protein